MKFDGARRAPCRDFALANQYQAMSQNCTVTPMQPLLSKEPKRPNSTVTGRPPAPLLSPAWAAGAGQRASFYTPSRVAPCTEALYGASSLGNTVQCQPLRQFRPLLATVSKLHAVATRCLPASVPTRCDGPTPDISKFPQLPNGPGRAHTLTQLIILRNSTDYRCDRRRASSPVHYLCREQLLGRGEKRLVSLFVYPSTGLH